jgi:hypothetical protein
MGRPKKGETIYMRRTTFATQWAAKNEKGNDEPEIPEEYRRHAIVFSEKGSKTVSTIVQRKHGNQIHSWRTY